MTKSEKQYTNIGESIASSNELAEISKHIETLKKLIAEKQESLQLLGTVVELGEKLYPATAAEGRETIRLQLEDIQQRFESLYDQIETTERDLHLNLSK